ncbi:MAG: AmmeMemoRadiSam system radical SAM enzyme, partial [Clostridia bacterium]|nr:AmmeMemoRadiSam system radical SAM enzyme [Clostridia bacterium]
MKEALWYEKLENKTVRCQLCPHGCAIKPGDRGICRVRENRGGKLFATNYGKAGGFAVDPMEKKPLYNFYPGSYVVSAGARGCNFSCEFCQNWQLARGESRETDISPHSMIHVAERHQKTHDVVGLAYTYSEPFMWYEFVLDTSRLAEEAGLKNIMVTNGFVREKPLRRLLPHIDAMNIDVKGFTEEFYREIIHGSLKPVLRTAEMAKESGCHVEITTLLIPGLNDSHGELKQLVDWVSDSLGKGTPLHFSRYFPNHRMDIPAT